MPLHRFDECKRTALRAHAGVSHVLAATVRGRREHSNINFVDMVEMPPGSTVGRHRHSLTDEEIYIVLAGEGEILIDGRYERIGRGDVAVNPPGGEHGLRVLGQQPLLMIVVDVSVDGSEYRQPVNIDK
jgi:mannose-6-phosphate isomerase-like protein (cupin superfamily)